MKTKRFISKRRLQQHLNELVELAKARTSDVTYFSHIPGDERQHAWLKIYVPDELADQIDDLVSERAHNIFIETGYDIGAIVYEKSQLRLASAETVE
jgi:hypothetical protein